MKPKAVSFKQRFELALCVAQRQTCLLSVCSQTATQPRFELQTIQFSLDVGSDCRITDIPRNLSAITPEAESEKRRPVAP
jgi:hypothetical protein